MLLGSLFLKNPSVNVLSYVSTLEVRHGDIVLSGTLTSPSCLP